MPKRRLKRFIIVLGIFLAPLLIYPLSLILSSHLLMPLGLIVFFPALFSINVPAIFYSATGIRYYKGEEFGALPGGFIDWGLIILFWIVIAYLLSSISLSGNKKIQKNAG